MADTMNHWIRDNRAELDRLLTRVDGLLVNDEEARLLSEEDHLLAAGKRILGMGPEVVLIKKGEHGSLIFANGECAALPGYPTEQVVDPTGAGDSFAGGLMGYVAAQGNLSQETLLRAAAYGTVVASFTVEEFGLGALQRTTRQDVEARLEKYRAKLRV
jgi:sugar/nucleoside kinase (ribokinase family)